MLDILDQYLKKKNLKFEDLTQDEKDTYLSWVKALEGKSLGLEDVRNYIRFMKSSVAATLADTKEEDREANLLLKARLKNYILLEDMLSGPEKASQAVAKYIGGQANSSV